MALSALALGAILYFKGERTPTIPDRAAAIVSIKSIAVLPPEPLGGEVENDSLSLGVTDALITRLRGFRKLVVRPTSAIVRFGGNQDPAGAGRALGVDAVLDGTVQRDRGRVRVTIRLVNVANGMQLWTDNVDEADADIFKLQDSVSQRVAEALFTNLSQDEKKLLTKQQKNEPGGVRSLP
jgi:TolB-like protein